MSSLDTLRSRYYASEGIVVRSTDDTPVAIRIRNKAGLAVTSVTVTTATNIVLIDSAGTTTLAFATYTTVGSLAAALNATTSWEAVVLDALLADSTGSSAFVDGAISSGTDENGVTVWDVKPDTSVVKSITVALSTHRNFDMPKTHRVHLQEILYNVDVNAASANGVRVYRRRGGTETLIWSKVSVDATTTTINFASGMGKISGKADDDLIVRIQDGTSVSDSANNIVQATGYYE